MNTAVQVNYKSEKWNDVVFTTFYHQKKRGISKESLALVTNLEMYFDASYHVVSVCKILSSLN